MRQIKRAQQVNECVDQLLGRGDFYDVFKQDFYLPKTDNETRVRELTKTFSIALIVNLSLLIAYEVFYSAELLDFAKRTINPDSISLTWTPIVITMPFGTHQGNVYADGVVLMPNLIFFILLALVCFNLYAIWRIERSKTTSTRKPTV